MNDQDTFNAIEAADEARRTATLAADIDTVEKQLGKTLRYVHGSGVDEHKPQYLQRLREGYYKYLALDVSRREYRRFGDVVLVHGDVRINVIVNGVEKDFNSRYLQVWALEDGHWGMVAWESTKLP